MKTPSRKKAENPKRNLFLIKEEIKSEKLFN
jgi:hypothetical protein